ncbi:hypothetical protein NLX83_25480 [Allokutzneria sp. A3M-2-11 16]|uniref:hypothetical protein n=1 Tax=Allokutzneria sp. A3M-2-11 16 TaxID=2962043 RepID=UPI0020B86282|nr:hypothetical protein [Allokutzneria sp. A3M-2-11 16]MCP3802629.1 hypothetical protein [Allokutzneria sp. A3M-2-11 16]
MNSTIRRAGVAALAVSAITTLALPASAAPAAPVYDIGIEVSSKSTHVAKDALVEATVVVSNKGTVEHTGGDWFTIRIPHGIAFSGASGDTWNCVPRLSEAWAHVHCRSEAAHAPGTSRPPVKFTVRPTIAGSDTNVEVSVAGFRRSETGPVPNSALLRITAYGTTAY